MDAELILLKAQFEALRIWTIVKVCQDLCPQEKWKSKYHLWQLERESLQAQETSKLSSLERNRVCQREYQLQILLDVSYIRGCLQEYDEVRYIDPTALEIVSLVAADDFDEETILYKVGKCVNLSE